MCGWETALLDGRAGRRGQQDPVGSTLRTTLWILTGLIF